MVLLSNCIRKVVYRRLHGRLGFLKNDMDLNNHTKFVSILFIIKMDYLNHIPMKNDRQLRIRGENTRMSLAIGSFKSQESEVISTISY